MDILNKKQTIKIINDSTNIKSKIEYNNNSFTMNVVGDIMPKQENKISLNSIYELMITKFESIEKRLESIENDINIMKCLPTISKELKEL